MKSSAVFFLLLTLLSTAYGDTIALWTFETPNIPGSVTGTTSPSVSPSVGSGSIFGFHVNTNTTFSSAVGNGSSNSIVANYWSANDYWQIQVSTLGYKDIQISFDQAGSQAGPTNWAMLYSTDGVSFSTNLNMYQVLSTNFWGVWDSSTPDTDYTRTVDLSSRTVLNDAPIIYLRLRHRVSIPSFLIATSYGELDNVIITGTLIPEPAALPAAAFIFALLHRSAYRRSGNRVKP